MVEYENLVGVPFDPGREDCFQTVIDFYAQNFNIIIPKISRPTDWDADKADLIGTLYKRYGFEKVEGWDLQPGDILATAVGSSNPNHLVLYVGDNTILHHKFNSFSSAEAFRPFWKMVTCYVLRHPDVPNLNPIYEDVTVESLLKNRHNFL